MKNLHFFQLIAAPQNVVWEIMWSKKTFGLWMHPMGEGHYYEPSLFQGGYIRWLTPSGDGMYGKVLELIPNEKITFEHHGWISNGIDNQEDTFNSLEKYTLSASSNGTMVTIYVETFPEYEKLMIEKYPLVLAELNNIASAAFSSQDQNH